jgi:Rrf2 family transcriptional regulator, iron-sulfur cluster assembly transcription factor
MFRMSKKMMFAIETVLDIAYHAGSATVQSAEITKRQGIPKRYLEQALQALVRAGILAGVRGPKGGYRLARERRRISVADIVRVVRALEQPSDAIEEEPTSPLGRLVVRPMWTGLQDEAMQRLENVTIEDLCSRARHNGIASDAASRLDFSI